MYQWVMSVLVLVSCIFTGGSGSDVHSQQGNGTGRDLIREILSFIPLTNQVKYIGHADFAAGIWIGLELRNPKGKQTSIGK